MKDTKFYSLLMTHMAGRAYTEDDLKGEVI